MKLALYLLSFACAVLAVVLPHGGIFLLPAILFFIAASEACRDD